MEGEVLSISKVETLKTRLFFGRTAFVTSNYLEATTNSALQLAT